jgi:hypothetical protein
VLASGTRGLYGAWASDDRVDAVGAIERASQLAAATGSATLIGWAAWYRGLVLIREDPAGALEALDAARAAVAGLTDLHFVDLGCQVWLNTAAVMTGELDRAVATLQEVLSLSSAHRTENVTVNVLRNAALLLADLGQPFDAARLLGAAEATGHRGGGHSFVVDLASAAIARAMPTGIAAAIEAGRALSLRDAVRLALGALDEAERVPAARVPEQR